MNISLFVHCSNLVPTAKITGEKVNGFPECFKSLIMFTCVIEKAPLDKQCICVWLENSIGFLHQF